MSSGLQVSLHSATSFASLRSSGRIRRVSEKISDAKPHERKMLRMTTASLLMASPCVYPATS